MKPIPEDQIVTKKTDLCNLERERETHLKHRGSCRTAVDVYKDLSFVRIEMIWFPKFGFYAGNNICSTQLYSCRTICLPTTTRRRRLFNFNTSSKSKRNKAIG